MQELTRLQENENVKIIRDLIQNDTVMKKMENIRDSKALINYLTTESQGKFKVEMVDDFVKLAKFSYEIGNYQTPVSHLYFYMLIMPPSDKVRRYGLSTTLF